MTSKLPKDENFFFSESSLYKKKKDILMFCIFIQLIFTSLFPAKYSRMFYTKMQEDPSRFYFWSSCYTYHKVDLPKHLDFKKIMLSKLAWKLRDFKISFIINLFSFSSRCCSLYPKCTHGATSRPVEAGYCFQNDWSTLNLIDFQFCSPWHAPWTVSDRCVYCPQ